ncbi:MAG: DUF3631 domain-containing protein [Micrococcales bacterium]|nr:DUF3631 domain-containing protein [Micrococcales bacterium]
MTTTHTPPTVQHVTPDDGAQLLDQVRAAVRRYVILPDEHAEVGVTLWVAATHAVPAWAHAARLVIRAPEKRCGKSRLLDLVEAMCHQPLITVNISSSALYRSVGMTASDPPTLLIDEADAIFGPKAAESAEDLRGLLNAGHGRNRPAMRYDAGTRRVEKIDTFAMAALAGIGQMPDTIEDRAVVVRMRRRAPGERVAPYRVRRDGPPLDRLRARLHTWVRDSLTHLGAAVPVMPVEDRAADTWEPLVAVADLASGHWPDLARQAAVALTASRDAGAQQSTQTRLLTDCRTVWGAVDALPTADLLDRLKADPEAPWATWAGTGLTPHKLGAMLREFDITSRTLRFSTGQAKGYARADFTDAWARYCPPGTDLTPAPPQGLWPEEVSEKPTHRPRA